MILKQLRLSRHLSQEQLAQMSGLNVRTIQRIESGHNASIESLKCLASVLEVDISTLNQENFVADKSLSSWKTLPFWLKAWFALGTLKLQPSRELIVRIEVWLHACGYPLCVFGFVSGFGRWNPFACTCLCFYTAQVARRQIRSLAGVAGFRGRISMRWSLPLNAGVRYLGGGDA